MICKHLTYFKSIVVVIIATMLFSCSTSSKSDAVEYTNHIPQSESYDFQLIYTEQGKVRAILKSPLNQDFSAYKFPYSLFPSGAYVVFFDDKGNLNTVTSSYAAVYHKTQIVELKDSVELTLFDGRKLQTSQLFWDQQKDWIFTDKNFTLIDTINHTITKGVGVDFDKNVSVLKAHEITGVLPIRQDD